MQKKIAALLVISLCAVRLAGAADASAKAEHHEHAMAKDADAFHAVLAPLWHAPASAERTDKVCAQTPTMEGLAAAIHSGDAKPLQAAVGALKQQCQAKPADIEHAFAGVHDAFHQLIKK